MMLGAPSRELLYTKHGGRYLGSILDVDHRQLKTDDYGKIYARFARNFRIRPDHVNMVTLDEFQREGQIYWSEGLARGGCIFTLYCLPGTEDKAVLKLKNRLRRTRDVHAVYTIKIDEIIPYERESKEPAAAGSE